MTEIHTNRKRDNDRNTDIDILTNRECHTNKDRLNKERKIAKDTD